MASVVVPFRSQEGGSIPKALKIQTSPGLSFFAQLGAWFHVVMSLLLSCHGLSVSQKCLLFAGLHTFRGCLPSALPN